MIPFWLIVYGVLASVLGLMKAIANIVISCKKSGDKKTEFEGIDCFSAVLLFSYLAGLSLVRLLGIFFIFEYF